MAAIEHLMKRLGYVRLSKFGLVLTPEGRVVSLRPATLDDGLGARIVGWRDGDLAAMELEKWEPARPAPQAAVANRVAAPAWPAPIPVQRPMVVPVSTIAAVSPGPVPIPTAPVVVAAALPMVAKLAPAAVVEETEADEDDEWMWTIALARANAEEADIVRPRRMRADTVPPPVVAAAAPARPDPIHEDTWPKTEPLSSVDYVDYSSPTREVVRVVAMAHTRRVTLPARPTPATPLPVVSPPQLRSVPSTVIPVPVLPSTTGLRIEPVVRVVRAAPVSPPRRLAKGTGPIVPRAATLPLPVVRPFSDDTVPSLQLPTAALPPLPSIKRA